MFFGKLTNFINKELTQLTREVRAGHNKIFEDIEYLTKIVQAIKNKVGDSDLSSAIVSEDCASANVEIDFNNMDVFSMERKIIDGQPCTIIGHWDLSGGAKTPREWSLFCNKESHEQLIKEFKIHKKNRVS